MTAIFGPKLEYFGGAGDAMTVFNGIYVKYHNELRIYMYLIGRF